MKCDTMDKVYLSAVLGIEGRPGKALKMLDGHKIVALCTARIHDEDSYKFIERLNNMLVSRGHRLFVFSTTSDLLNHTASDIAQKTVYELMNFDVVDVVAIMEEKINDKSVVEDIIRRTRAAGKPVITVGKEYEGCGNLQFAYEKGFEKIVRHMIVEHGVLDLHLIAGMPDNEFSDDRIAVFRRVLEANGGIFREDMVSYGMFWSEPTREAIEKLIRENRVPRGIICCNDIMAITVCTTLRKYGYNIPGDVLVTGFDGIDAIQFSEPPVTSCQCRFEDLAERLAECIDEDCSGYPQMRKKISPFLIRSESCGCMMGMHMNASEQLTSLNNRFFLYQDDEYTMTEVSAMIQTSNNMEEASACLNGHYQVHEMCCILRKEMTDESRNPLEPLVGDPFGENLYVFFDADYQKDFTPYDMARKDIIPDLEERALTPYPLVFSVLNFLMIPMGYICFYFRGLDRNRLVKIPQTVSILNNALGSLRNMRYQRYLIRRIEGMYKKDSLTDLYNRNSFYQAFHTMQEQYETEGIQPTLTIIFADVDGLKTVNDVYGHAEGDVAIRITARALRFACPESALCVRFGGDEMIAVTDEACDESRIRQRFEQYIAERNQELHKPYRISASMGVFTTKSEKGLDFEALLKEADQLMYQEKRAKKAAQEKKES